MRPIFRAFFTIIFLVIQLSFVYLLYLATINNIYFVKVIYSFFCLYLILRIIKDSRSYSYILPWIIIFIMFPIPGSIIYLTIKFNKKYNRLYNSIISEEKTSKKYLTQDEKIVKEFENNSIINYMSKTAKFPVTTNNDVKYYSLGDYALEAILEELKKAEKFIFIEYFIINKGKMWNSILEVLLQKVQEGVEVRVMYDDVGCLTTLNKYYYKTLREKGIKCVSFNRLRAFGGVIMNNRDHRKILVIDGKVAFSGGINIADEYINVGSKYGHWKDNCIRIKGEAVWNYTVMFLTLWNSIMHDDKDYKKYKYNFKENKIIKGYVSPYGENPLDNELIGEDIYLNIINQANKYVYIFTPYLIIDTDLVDALILAAKRGVDVRIVIPGIPDKKTVYTISESYIEPLTQGGVKIYKYTPGFIHSKVFVSDDIRATVGTLNMDYRSLYIHFECGCYLENHEVIKDIKKDTLETMEKSHLVTEKEAKTGHIKSFKQSVLRLFAPLT